MNLRAQVMFETANPKRTLRNRFEEAQRTLRQAQIRLLQTEEQRVSAANDLIEIERSLKTLQSAIEEPAAQGPITSNYWPVILSFGAAFFSMLVVGGFATGSVGNALVVGVCLIPLIAVVLGAFFIGWLLVLLVKAAINAFRGR